MVDGQASKKLHGDGGWWNLYRVMTWHLRGVEGYRRRVERGMEGEFRKGREGRLCGLAKGDVMMNCLRLTETQREREGGGGSCSYGTCKAHSSHQAS
jgi:hypothetical protein